MPQADLYVSTKGNDSWSGKLSEPNAMRTDGPFASIEGAQKSARELRKSVTAKRPVTVLIREGVYRLAKPIVFKPEDSGTKQGPTTFSPGYAA